MKYMWRCSPLAVILTAISSLAMFGIFYQLGAPGIVLFVAAGPFVFGFAWMRLGQEALLRSIREARGSIL